LFTLILEAMDFLNIKGDSLLLHRLISLMISLIFFKLEKTSDRDQKKIFFGYIHSTELNNFFLNSHPTTLKVSYLIVLG